MIRRGAGWGNDSVVFCSAGRFALKGPPLSQAAQAAVSASLQHMESWLLARAGGRIRVALAVSEDAGSDEEQYLSAQRIFSRDRAQPWRRVLATSGSWRTDLMVLAPLDSPCSICRRQRGELEEETDDGVRRVCSLCHSDLELGKKLPRMNWLTIGDEGSSSDLRIAGLSVGLTEQEPTDSGQILAASSLRAEQPMPDTWPADKVLSRSLARRIPVSEHGYPVDFETLAARATGASLLGVLKMDVDSLGASLHALLGASGLTALAALSKNLDDFFARVLDTQLGRTAGDSIYTVFAGGDDLLVIAPWNVTLDYAGEVEKLFRSRFSNQQLTISAGVSFLGSRRPIRSAVESAAESLHRAKNEPSPRAETARDQMSAFGQVWKWRDHAAVIEAGKRLARWVLAGKAERGWLRTLLEFAEAGSSRSARNVDPTLATARLAYHVARNYPRGEVREWGRHLVEDFEIKSQVETQYLSSIARYAMTATRGREG